jgi:2'-5' RNA ligase
VTPDETEALRLFVALELPEGWLRALATLQDELRRTLDLPGRGLRWTRPEGIHLTLKFLGAAAAVQRPAIEAALQGALADRQAPSLKPGGLGSFGGRRPQVLWLGLDGDLDAVRQLAAAVDAALTPLGFSAETRPFAAHLTLARVPEDAAPAALARVANLVASQNARLDAPAAVFATATLFRSQLGPGGARYQRLVVIPLRQAR